MSIFHNILTYLSNVITFKDINIKECLLSSSAINTDGTRDITYTEAKAVTDESIIKDAINPDHINNPNTDIVSFEEFELFEGVTKIYPNTFNNCTNLKYIRFPENSLNQGTDTTGTYKVAENTSIEVLHLENQDGLVARHQNQGVGTMFGYLPNLTEVYIQNVTRIIGDVFNATDTPNVEKIIISSIEQWLSIDDGNYGRNNRPSVSDKASLYLESDTEHPITNITTLTEAISGRTTVPTIFPYTFANLKNLETITIGAPNTDVKQGAFVNLPDTVSIINFGNIATITPGCFQNCKAQGIINVPSSVTQVGEYAFRYSNLLQLISDNLIQINGIGAFESCEKLKIVSINNCTSLGANAFYRCYDLESAYANSLQTINNSAFRACSSLKTIVAENVTTINNLAFAQCLSLTVVRMPNLKIINDEAFWEATSLRGIDCDLSHIEYIGCNAFNSAKMTCPIEFFSLTSIGNNAFKGGYRPSTGYVIFNCQNIVAFIPTTNPEEYINYSGETFGTTGTINKIYVPDDSLEIDGVTKTYKQWYEGDTQWDKFLYYNPSVSFDTINNIPT